MFYIGSKPIYHHAKFQRTLPTNLARMMVQRDRGTSPFIYTSESKKYIFEIKTVSRDDVSAKVQKKNSVAVCATKFPTSLIPVNLEFYTIV